MKQMAQYTKKMGEMAGIQEPNYQCALATFQRFGIPLSQLTASMKKNSENNFEKCFQVSQCKLNTL